MSRLAKAVTRAGGALANGSRVRSKIWFGWIKTVRGEGYQLAVWLPQ